MTKTQRKSHGERHRPAARYHGGVKRPVPSSITPRVAPLRGDAMPPAAVLEQSGAQPVASVAPFLAWPSQLFEMMMGFWGNFTPLAKTQPSGDALDFPKTESKETDKEYLYRIALPGMQRSQMRLNFHNRSLMLRVQTSDKRRSRGRRRFQSIHRAFTLPVYTDASAVHASFRNGMLTIAIPKTDKPVSPKAQNIDID